MGDSGGKSKAEVLQGYIVRFKDLHNAYVGLVEKVDKLQMDAQEAGLDTMADKLGKPFGCVSDSVKVIEGIIHDAELEINKIGNESK